jgi:CubicO group peptidase (beta-lactamase class C family)
MIHLSPTPKAALAGCLTTLVLLATISHAQTGTGLAPEVTDLNAKDVSYELEHKLQYLDTPYISVAPDDKQDGIPVGTLSASNVDAAKVLQFAKQLSQPAPDEKTGNVDSLLIYHEGALILEAYYRRGRANYPHYQMSITKSYTAMAIGRAIQLGYMTMDDLDKPVISFLDEIDTSKLVAGAETITLHDAMHMCSGVRLIPEKVNAFRQDPKKLKGQGQIQAYLESSEPIPPAPRKMKYQAADPAMAMQVLEAVVPGSAEDFIRDELFKPLGITNYHWQEDLSGLPKSAAGSSFRSRDMLKMGMFILNQGEWQGQQLIPSEFIEQATSKLVHSYGTSHYGYFWWVEDFEIGGKTYTAIEGRGAGGQFIFMFPELDLIGVVTSHNKSMGKMLETLPTQLIPAFVD